MTRVCLPVLLVCAACLHRSAEHRSPDPRPPGTVLTADDIRNSPGQSLEQLLLARVPGLTVERAADGHSKLVLRGKNTILGDDEVLFVVNGIPLGPAVSGNLSAVDTHDIETVQVLRDAVATAAYGVRGANGVILIRTKQS
ncbi:MAG TPA: TonB-dependent receptor plug domain-containing protein [Gemmatimonadales bacterium]